MYTRIQMKWNTEEAGKRNQKPIHVEKCNKDINGKKRARTGVPIWLLFLLFPIAELGKSGKRGGKNKEITLPTSERIWIKKWSMQWKWLSAHCSAAPFTIERTKCEKDESFSGCNSTL